MRLKLWRALACLVVMGALAAMPITNAPASAGSIKMVLKSYTPKIKLAETEVASSLAEFEKTKNLKTVQAALAGVVNVLKSLDGKVAAQSAPRSKVKKAKTKIVDGLKAFILAYDKLEKAVGEIHVKPATVKAEAEKAKSALKAGARQLNEGEKLLG